MGTGAFEMPGLAAKAARSGKFDAVICLGAVIRGATAHFDYVAGPCASGLMNVSIETETPSFRCSNYGYCRASSKPSWFKIRK